MSKLYIKKLVLSICATNCYIIYNKDTMEGFIIDPAANADVIDTCIKELGVDIKGILLTHGHFDHIGAAEELKKLYQVKVYAHEEEAEITENGMLNLSAMFETGDSVRVDVKLHDGDTFNLCGFDIKLIHTPGHTKGSSCYLINDGEKDRLFSGDTIFCGSYGRTDFPTGDMRQLIDSILNKLLVLDEDLEVYSGHGEQTFIGDEKKNYRR